MKDLVAYDFVKSHDNVILSVLHGDFAAGGARLDVFGKYADRPLRVLAGPFLTPPHALVCRTDLEPGLKDKLRQSLLALTDPGVLASIDPAMLRFDPVTDRDFDQARAIIDYIEAR
jgi:phosphonate transport system substrate-binding protein